MIVDLCYPYFCFHKNVQISTNIYPRIHIRVPLRSYGDRVLEVSCLCSAVMNEWWALSHHRRGKWRRRSEGEDRPRKVQFSKLRKPHDLDSRVKLTSACTIHTRLPAYRTISTHIPNYIKIGKTFCGCTYARTDGRTQEFSKSIISPLGDDLKIATMWLLR